MKTGVNQKHGLDRGAVASTQALAHSQTTSRWSRSALARCASRAERNPVGFAHRSSLARSARPLYPPYQTCHRRFQQWQRDGTLTRLLHALAEDLRARGKLDLSETFIDASFSSAKKGALL